MSLIKGALLTQLLTGISSRRNLSQSYEQIAPHDSLQLEMSLDYVPSFGSGVNWELPYDFLGIGEDSCNESLEKAMNPLVESEIAIEEGLSTYALLSPSKSKSPHNRV